MRVISQDGTIDVPYETGSFNMIRAELVEPKHTNIYCHHSSIGVAIKIAEYSTETKAIKAMEMLRDQYKRLEVFKVLASGAVEHIGKTLKNDELVEYNQAYRDMNVFQFPQDGEIEV